MTVLKLEDKRDLTVLKLRDECDVTVLKLRDTCDLFWTWQGRHGRARVLARY